jgi:PAS domain S-box-containing protein
MQDAHPIEFLPPLSMAEYRTLVEHSPVLVWRSGIDGACDHFNERWLAFTGRALAQELGNGWAEGVHSDDFDRCLRTYLAAFGRREPFEMEYRLRRYDGAYRYLLDRGAPYWDDEGRFAGYIGSCIDIDERRLADRDRAMFLSMLAHEMRSPLTTLRLMFCRKQGAPARVVSQLDRLERLVRDLGDTGRIEQGRGLSLTVDALDLGELASRMIEVKAAATASPSGSSRIVMEAGGGPFRVAGDAVRLEQVVANLLENALKYSPANSTVRVRLCTEGDGHRLSVQDRGIGIAPEDLPLVTRKYFRARNARSTGGLGLGLAIGREIIEAHSGRMEIDSQLDRGTTVTLVLPILDE